MRRWILSAAIIAMAGSAVAQQPPPDPAFSDIINRTFRDAIGDKEMEVLRLRAQVEYINKKAAELKQQHDALGTANAALQKRVEELTAELDKAKAPK